VLSGGLKVWRNGIVGAHRGCGGRMGQVIKPGDNTHLVVAWPQKDSKRAKKAPKLSPAQRIAV